MRSSNWFVLFMLAAVLGIGAGYLVTLFVRPALLPPALRLGGLRQPTTVLFLGTDVVYTRKRRGAVADADAFTGRSDTILVARLDPVRNSVGVLSIPRDTQVYIPGHGVQKINSANAIGGPLLAREVVSGFLNAPIDHYLVLNVHGLVELVDTLGGITVEIPKRMKYRDRAAKLAIDLKPGHHTLDGGQAMGFVRFRHDALGDIGRVQRQEIFLRAVLDRALQPESWPKVPELIGIGRQYVATDMTDAEILKMITFIRAVPKENQHLVMLPGRFSGTGDWIAERGEVSEIMSRLLGTSHPLSTKMDVRIAIENASSQPGLGRSLSRLLRDKGYDVISVKTSTDRHHGTLERSRIIAQRHNTADADMVRIDLGNRGEVVNASIGDIESTVTVIAGDDLAPLVSASAGER